VQAQLDQGRPVRGLDLTEDDKAELYDLHLLTIKPTLYVANVTRTGSTTTRTWDAVRAHALAEGSEVVPVCAALEAEIAQLDEASRKEFLADLGLDRAWPEPRGARRLPAARPADLLHGRAEGMPRLDDSDRREAPQAAAVIHTDFERGSSARR